MNSTTFVAVVLLVTSPATCSSRPQKHSRPVHHTTSCIPQALRSSLSVFRYSNPLRKRIPSDSSKNKKTHITAQDGKFHEKMVHNFSTNRTNYTPGKERNVLHNGSASAWNQSLLVHSLVLPQKQLQTNISMPNQTARKSKCPGVKIFNRVCCNRTVIEQAMNDRVTSNETKSRCPSLEQCLACSKAMIRIKNLKNTHKRLNKREVGIYRKSELPDDASLMISGSSSIFRHPKLADDWQEAVYKYIFYLLLGEYNDHTYSKKRRDSNGSVQLTDAELNQLLELLGHGSFKIMDDKSVNMNHVCDLLARSSVSYADTIKSKIRCEHYQDMRQGLGYMKTIKDSLIKPCGHLPVNDRALKILRSSDGNEVNNKDVLAVPCFTFTEKTAPLDMAITKKSDDPFSDAPDAQSLVFTEFGSCSHHIETKLITLPGCVPKSVLITSCQGSCHSSSVPDWDVETQDVRHTEHCTCCSSHVIKFRTLRFHCPRRPEGVVLMTMGFPFRCACRPCAILPEVRAEQPYDY